MGVNNLSGTFLKISPRIANYKRMTIMPDYSPNKGLPTGSVTVFSKDTHKINPDFLGSDVGCGMLLAKFEEEPKDLEKMVYNLAERLNTKRKGIGSLGGGNHFMTFYQSEPKGSNETDWFVLIHSGSRQEGINLLKSGLVGDDYIAKHNSVLNFAKDNRLRLLSHVQDFSSTNVNPVLDKVHNFLEFDSDEVIYRKGAVKVNPQEISFIPSSMAGSAALISATQKVLELDYSLPHATGRVVPRSSNKPEHMFFLEGMPKNIFFPTFADVEHYNAELPQNYRGLNDVLEKMREYVSIEKILSPRASLML